MSNATLSLTPDLLNYLNTHSMAEPQLLRQLREATQQQFEAAPMQISPEQGHFFRWLVQLMQAKKVLELGTFTGYSSICMALALPDDGKVVCCDTSVEWTALARQYWEKMGLTDKITLHLQPALKSLQQFIEQGEANSYDFIFIDADKPNYINYYELSLQLLRQGGVVAIDNVLWDGEVINADNQDENTNVIRKLNKLVCEDERVVSCMLPLSDGLTLAIKL